MKRAMPAKKVKYTDGVLARDKESVAGHVYIAFFPGFIADEIRLNRNSVWIAKNNRKFGGVRFWDLRKWKAAYKLAPPAKGRCFECEVEL